jgi:predicted nucleic acid-binding protein
MVIVDTTVWIDYLRGLQNRETQWFDKELARQRFGLTDLILCEVLQGIRGEKEFSQARRELGKFELFTTGGEELAVAAAVNFRTLRERGRTFRKTIDCLIATSCILRGHSLLHRDRDFAPFEQLLGLSVVHP